MTEPLNIATTVTIPLQRVADLFVNAIEGGSNYWMTSLRPGDKMRERAPKDATNWYESGASYATDDDTEVLMTVLEDEGTEHTITLGSIRSGLQFMADSYPTHFADILTRNDDAITGDVFVQCVVFGEIIYG